MTTDTLSIEDQIANFYLDIARVDRQLAEFAVARAQLTKDIDQVLKLAEQVKGLSKDFLSLSEKFISAINQLEAITDDPDDQDDPVTLN